MSEIEDNKKKKAIEVHVANITHHEGPIVLPTGMTNKAAIEILTRKETYDQEEVSISDTMPVFVWDGALALQKAITEMFGIALQTEAEIKTFFGTMKEPPAMISIETGPDTTVSVPWGWFSLPGIKGYVATGHTKDNNGRFVFVANAKVRHGDERAVRKLFALTREIALRESIYKGKAISIKFRNEDGDALQIPTITFPRISDGQVILNRGIEDAISSNILSVLRHTDVCRQAQIPIKRGALFAGRYGTGKTLAANMIAREAVASSHGWTFIYVKDCDEMAEALRFAQAFQPAVVFTEDIERHAGAERTDEVNELLNTLDGIGSKSDEIITILTSNHPENISAAMRRPGRIDLVLHIAPPDAEAAVRLLHLYGRGQIAEGQDLAPVGEALEGQIPAVIREVVERAKLETIARTGKIVPFMAADLSKAAEVLKTEQKLFAPKAEDPPMAIRVADTLGRHIGSALHIAVLEARSTE